MKNLRLALSGNREVNPPTWREVIGELLLNEDKIPEELLQEILGFDGELYLDLSDCSDGPHAISPEEMLKSLARQILEAMRRD